MEATKPLESVFSKNLKVWLVGSLEETEFLWDFLYVRMESTDSEFNDTQMSGQIILGDRNIFPVSCFIKSQEEFEKEPKENLEPDGLIICENELYLDSLENRKAYHNFLEWGNLKALGFFNPMTCPEDYHSFSDLNQEEDIESDLEDFFKTLKLPKKKNTIKEKGTKYFDI